MAGPVSRPSSPTRRSRVRTKRFTGCWTCRSRKIRCDEGRPACGQCSSKNIPCGGFHTRLQWMPPETWDRGPANTKIMIEPKSRRLLLSSSDIVLDGNEVDHIYAKIDCLARAQCASSTKTWTSGPFGVFSTHGSPQPTLPPPICPSAPTRPLSDSLGSPDLPGLSTPPGIPPDYNPRLTDGWAPHCNPAFTGPVPEFLESVGFTQPGQQMPARTEIDTRSRSAHEGEHQFSGSRCLPLVDQHSPGQVDHCWRTEPDSPDHAVSLSSAASPTRRGNLPPSALSHEHRYLLDYYIHRVVRILCIVDNPNSPWNTIHLPKVLHTAGELAVTGTTTLIRQALFNTLLSESAFILSREYRADPDRSKTQRWENRALDLRRQAIGLLKESVSKEYYSVTKPKYKDFLATMLSMVTVSAIAGDTSACTVHLDGCEQLIREFSKSKLSFSSKARALHRIYFYLRTIHASTWYGEENQTIAPLFDPSPLSSSTSSPSLGGAESAPTFESPSWLDLSRKTYGDKTTFELVYGLPESLFVLLNKCISVAKHIERESNEGLGSASAAVASFCDKLETDIFEWPKEAEIERCLRVCNDSKSVAIVKHQINAFYNALIIYFSHCVRGVSHRYLRQYAANTLESMEAMEGIKIAANITAGPIFWPIFVAASVAVDDEYRSRFATLFDWIESYGFQATRVGHDIIREVWQRWQVDRVHEDWRSVVKRRGINLMLT